MFGSWIYWVSFPFIVFLLVVLWIVYPPDSPWSPWWKTDKKVARAAARLAKIGPKDRVYELGSGDGEFVLWVGKNIGGKVVGIEFDIFRHWWAKMRLMFSGRTKGDIILTRDNFYNVNLKPATVVYFYLVPAAIKRLMPKFKKELKPGTKIMSYRYKAEGLEQIGFDKKNKIYLYKI